MDAGKTARSVLSLVLALCLAAPAAYASEPSGGGSPQGSEAQASPDSAAWLISELDDGGTFTACELAPYSAEMDAASVSAERFAFECGTDPAAALLCRLTSSRFPAV